MRAWWTSNLTKTMTKNKYVGGALDVVLFILVFVLLQWLALMVVGMVASIWRGVALSEVLRALDGGMAPTYKWVFIAGQVLGSVLQVALFWRLRWASFDRSYIVTRPWIALCWVVVLTFGTILPSEWLVETMHLDMPERQKQLLEDMMAQPLGYLAIGIMAPLAEETVFRGAILRRLLEVAGGRLHWLAIALSAVLFGLVHGNNAQFVHAFLLGLLLGWMFYRTGSILPGMVLHIVNNSVAYAVYNLLPQWRDARLIDLFGSNDRTLYLSLLFSLCIFAPALFQLVLRLRR